MIVIRRIFCALSVINVLAGCQTSNLNKPNTTHIDIPQTVQKSTQSENQTKHDTEEQPSPEETAQAPASSIEGQVAGGARVYQVPQLFSEENRRESKKPTTGVRPTPRISPKHKVYDPESPAYFLLQAPLEALKDLPVDAIGRVDWVQALNQGRIFPRADLDGELQMKILDEDIIMKNTREMPWVRFPHRQHTEWLACSNCHPSPFLEKSGANPVDMDAIFRGRYCGKCHDRVAFSIFLCERCHSVQHPGTPKPWW